MSSVSEWRTTPSARARRCGGHAAVDVHGEHEGVESSTDHMSEAEADRSGTFCQSAAAPLPRQRPGRRSSSHVSIKTVRKHKPDLGVNGRRVGERHGRVRDDVRSAFALRGESENRSLVFSLLRLRRCWAPKIDFCGEGENTTQRALRNICFSLSEKLDGYAMGAPLSGTAPTSHAAVHMYSSRDIFSPGE